MSEEVFDLVQLEIEARREYGNKYSGKGLFASRIVCGNCGGYFGSKVWHSTDRYRMGMSSNRTLGTNLCC